LEWSKLFDEEQECYATLAQFEEARLQNKNAENEDNGMETESNIVTASSSSESPIAQTSDEKKNWQCIDTNITQSEIRDEKNEEEVVLSAVTGSSLVESLGAQNSDERKVAQGADEKTAQNEMRDEHLIGGEMAILDLAKTNEAQSKIEDANAGNGESDDYNDSDSDESEQTENRTYSLSKEEREELEKSWFNPSIWELPDNWTVKEAVSKKCCQMHSK
jgi:hypothetical protein